MRHRPTGVLLASVASALLLAGCGGGDDGSAGAASSSAATGQDGGSSSGGSEAPDVEYDTIAVPDEFGGGEIPVPPGLTPGEPTVSDGNWTIEIDGIDKEEGVAFYREALAATGYTIDVDDPLLVSGSDGERVVRATLSPGPDGVDVTVEPVP